LETGLEIAAYQGENRFEETSVSWLGKEAVYTHLVLSGDSRYLAYEEHVEDPAKKAQSRVFTYCWRLKDITTVDDDHFGPCVVINRGIPVCHPSAGATTLRFCRDNTTLWHAGGKFDVGSQTHIEVPQQFTQEVSLRSINISSDGTTVHVTKHNNDASTSTLSLETWQCINGTTFSKVQEYMFSDEFLPIFMATSHSGRFVAFTQRLPQYPESESLEYDRHWSDLRTHSFKVLDTRTGFEHELYAYRNDTWDAKGDFVTPLRPDKAFFGHTEAVATLFVMKHESGGGPPEGRIWRRSLGGWVNIGRIRFDWACLPLEFSGDDSCIFGIRREGTFYASAEGLETAVRTCETGAFRQESEYSLRFWEGSSLYYVNSHTNYGTEYKVSSCQFVMICVR
jgi:hypothetical protein